MGKSEESRRKEEENDCSAVSKAEMPRGAHRDAPRRGEEEIGTKGGTG